MEAEELNRLLTLRLEQRDLCIAMHEAGHAMLADALNVGVERASIEGLYDSTINPRAAVVLVPGHAVSKAIVITLAG